MRHSMSRPGTHKRPVSEIKETPVRKSSRGILKGLFDDETVEAFSRALQEGKDERIASLEREQ